MKIEYDPKLVEQSVFLAARQDERLSTELHQATDPLYRLADSRDRQARFQEVYRTFFQRLGLDEAIPRLLQERPGVKDQVKRCLVCEAPRRKAESADLYVKDVDRSPSGSLQTLFIKICPQTLLDFSGTLPHLRRELMHVADMLDEGFGYRREDLVGHHPRQNLIRDRFRVMWDIHIEYRLCREGYEDDRFTRVLRQQFRRVFPGVKDSILEQKFDQVWNSAVLTHVELLDWASSPEKLFGDQASGHPDGHPPDGEMCPVCGFSTFDWCRDPDVLARIDSAVRQDYTGWEKGHGICRQCADIYEAVSAQLASP